MKLKIKSVENKPFTSGDGERVDYFWYRAVREDNECTIQFGSREGEHPIGEVVDLDIEKTERADGKFGYKEIVKN